MSSLSIKFLNLLVFPYSTPFLGYPPLKAKNPFQVEMIRSDGSRESFLFFDGAYNHSMSHERKVALIFSARKIVENKEDSLSVKMVTQYLCEGKDRGTSFQMADLKFPCK